MSCKKWRLAILFFQPEPSIISILSVLGYQCCADFVFSVRPIPALQDQQSCRFCLSKPGHGDDSSRGPRHSSPRLLHKIRLLRSGCPMRGPMPGPTLVTRNDLPCSTTVLVRQFDINNFTYLRNSIPAKSLFPLMSVILVAMFVITAGESYATITVINAIAFLLAMFDISDFLL